MAYEHIFYWFYYVGPAGSLCSANTHYDLEVVGDF